MKHIRRLIFGMLLGGLVMAAIAEDDVLRPRIPLHPWGAEMCPVSIFRPFSLRGCGGTPYEPNLKGCQGVWIGIGCSNWGEWGASLDFDYFQYNLEHNEFRRNFGLGLYQKSLGQLVRDGASRTLAGSDESGNIISDDAGIPVFVALRGDCGQEKTREIKATPISGENWTGWMWEQSFAEPKKKLSSPYCYQFTPKYRCISFIIGNDTVSAVFPNYCFLRKKVDSLDDELSYDVFMDMIKTIKFKEGSIEYQRAAE